MANFLTIPVDAVQADQVITSDGQIGTKTTDLLITGSTITTISGNPVRFENVVINNASFNVENIGVTAGEIAIDLSLANYFVLDHDEDVTTITITNDDPNNINQFFIKRVRDSAGTDRTIDFTGFETSDGTIVLTQTDGAKDLLEFTRDDASEAWIVSFKARNIL